MLKIRVQEKHLLLYSEPSSHHSDHCFYNTFQQLKQAFCLYLSVCIKFSSVINYIQKPNPQFFYPPCISVLCNVICDSSPQEVESFTPSFESGLPVANKMCGNCAPSPEPKLQETWHAAVLSPGASLLQSKQAGFTGFGEDPRPS